MIEKLLREKNIVTLEGDLPKEVIEEIKSTIRILNHNYGFSRNLTDDGGYVCIVKDEEHVNYLKEEILKGLIEEYSDVIYKSEEEIYNSTLYLLSTDYSVVIITKNEITDELLK